MTVKNHSSGHMAHMDFKALGWLGGDPHNVEGYIESPRYARVFLLDIGLGYEEASVLEMKSSVC